MLHINQVSRFLKYIFFWVFVPENQRDKSLKKQPRGKVSLAEQSEVEAGVVYRFKPSVLNNLCKQGPPISTRGAIMPLFTEAVAPHCPHQWGWWIDVWVWYLIKLTQLHNRGTPNVTLTQHTQNTKITSVFVKRVTWSWPEMNHCDQSGCLSVEKVLLPGKVDKMCFEPADADNHHYC